MKHSILLTGNNHLIIEDLFAHLWSDFECLTCSAGYEDIKNHLKHYTPDVLVCCLHDASGMQPILELRETIEKKNIILAVVGSKEDCATFTAGAPKLAKFVFEKPINPGFISDCLAKFMDKRDTDNLLSEIDALGVRKRIMVIDDDPFMLKLMTEYLQKDYAVETATSGKAAMQQLERNRADLILLDYEMPEESGPEVLEKLHKNDATDDIPVIFLTSIMYREMIEKALLLKPQGYLLKPVNRDMLLEAINNLLR